MAVEFASCNHYICRESETLCPFWTKLADRLLCCSCLCIETVTESCKDRIEAAEELL